MKWCHFTFVFNIKIFKNISACGLWLYYENFYLIEILSIFSKNKQTMSNFSIDKMYMEYIFQQLHICAPSLSFWKVFANFSQSGLQLKSILKFWSWVSSQYYIWNDFVLSSAWVVRKFNKMNLICFTHTSSLHITTLLLLSFLG